jgi:phosphoglycerol transferase
MTLIKKTKRGISHSWPYWVGALFVMLYWGWSYGNKFTVDLNYPLMEPGDFWANLAHTKALINGEWWPFFSIVLKRLGAPWGPLLVSVDYPLLEPLQYIFLKVIGFFFKNPALVLNIYYLLTFIFVFWAMVYACRKLRVSPEISFVAGILFTFLPYHISRYGHIMLAAYYLIPLAGLIILRLWSAKPLFVMRPGVSFASKLDVRSWFAFMVCIAVGWWHVYYAFFFCIFALVAGISAALYRKSWQHLLGAGVMIFLVVAALGISALPTLYGRHLYGKNIESMKMHQYTVSSETYALKLMNLIVPRPNHPVPIFRKFSEKYKSGTTDVEGRWEYIGTVSLLGLFCSLIGVFIFRAHASVLMKISALTTSGILYASLGGFSSLFAFITPLFRCPNRISPFLAFWGLFLVAFLLQALKVKMKNYRPLFVILLSGICLWGLWDQTTGIQLNPAKDRFISDEKFIHKIETVVPAGAVLQLPFMSGPESEPIFEMGDHSHFSAYVFSEKLSWSYGTIRGRPNNKNIEDISSEPLSLDRIRAAGYVGIYVDRYGYPNRQFLEEKRLENELKSVPLESGDKRFLFFKL